MMMLGKYRVRRRIAEGDLAEVLLASQQGLAGLEQLVVIKRVAAQPRSSEAFVRVFVEEARRAAQLRHPNIVEIHDVHAQADELCVVMDYVSGEDLDFVLSQQRAKRVPIPVPIAAQIISQAAEGLVFAHGATDPEGLPLELYHRELVPRNVMVSYSGEVKLLDFGISRADAQDVYKQPAALKSRLAYRSPERLRHREIDARADVYSLGVLFYELLVGRRLFKGDTASELLKTAMELEVPPPSQVNPQVPAVLDAVVMSAIARDPDQRTPTAERFLSQLDEAVGKANLVTRGSKVGEWMRDAYAERLAQRQGLEQTVSVDEDASMVATSISSAFSRGMPTGSNTISSVASLVGNTPHPQQKGRAALWAVIGALVTVLLLALLGIVYWMGRQEAGTPAASKTVATQQPVKQSSQTITDVSQSPASLLIHATPYGASVKVAGKEVGEVGPDGLLVPVMPERDVQIEVGKSGYKADAKQLRAPKQGTAHVYINLSREAPAAAVAKAEPVKPAEPVKATPVVRSQPRKRYTRRKRGGSKKKAATVDLRLSFSPSHATVVFDGKVRPGSSPLQLNDLKPGTHAITLRAPGYKTLTQRVELDKSRPDVGVTMRLEKKIVMVPARVTSEPVGARVMINGRAQGTTPLSGLQMEVGREYLVQVSKSGYKPWTRRVSPRAGTSPALVANLTRVEPPPTAAVAPPPAPKPAPTPKPAPPPAPTAFGKLYVLSPNVYGQVFVNGKNFGYPPIVVPRVPVGRAKVEIRVGGAVRRAKTVSVQEGRREKVQFR